MYFYETDHYNCRTKILYPPSNFISYNCAEGYKSAIPVDECLAMRLRNYGEKV